MIKDLICRDDSIIRDIFIQIDKNGYGTCFVEDNNKKLVGVITDGDLRRSMLGGYDLSSPIKGILKKESIYASSHQPSNEILGLLTEEIKIIPIVDDSGIVVDFATHNRIPMTPVATPDLYGNELKYITDAFLSTWISSSGEYINKLENSFAKYNHSKYATTVSNGTVALQLALKSIELAQTLKLLFLILRLLQQ